MGEGNDAGIKVLQHESCLSHLPYSLLLGWPVFWRLLSNVHAQKGHLAEGNGGRCQGGNGGLPQLNCFMFRDYGVAFDFFLNIAQVDLKLLILRSQAPKP